MTEPVAFEAHDPGVHLYGARAVLESGELLAPAQPSNYREDSPLRHVYVTETMHAAAWNAQLARGDAESVGAMQEGLAELRRTGRDEIIE
ncbi:MAG: NAD(+)--rifampin ADP-ribosyltransferase [Brachybacterium sp.]